MIAASLMNTVSHRLKTQRPDLPADIARYVPLSRSLNYLLAGHCKKASGGVVCFAALPESRRADRRVR